VSGIDWVEIDGWGQVVGAFHGTHEELCSHYSTKSHPDGKISTDWDTTIYLRHPVSRVRSTVVTMTAPWGRYRYIPKPTWME
jgi:hypothetical protein